MQHGFEDDSQIIFDDPNCVLLLGLMVLGLLMDGSGELWVVQHLLHGVADVVEIYRSKIKPLQLPIGVEGPAASERRGNSSHFILGA